MILLLDTSNIEISDYDEDTCLPPKNKNEFIIGFWQKIQLLRKYYDFSTINKIIIIDTRDEPFPNLDFNNIENLEKLFKEFSLDYFEDYKNLSLSVSVYDVKKLGFENSFEYFFDSLDEPPITLKTEELKKEIGTDKVLFFSNYLTLVSIFILKELPEIVGYRRKFYDVKNNSGLEYSKISNAKNFLDFKFELLRLATSRFIYKLDRFHPGELDPYTRFDDDYRRLLLPFFREIKKLDEDKKQKLFFVGKEKYLIREAITTIFGENKNIILIEPHYSLGISEGYDGVLIEDIDKALVIDGKITPLFTEILINLSRIEYKSKIIILHSNKNIDNVNLKGYCRILLPDSETKEIYYLEYFLKMLIDKNLIGNKDYYDPISYQKGLNEITKFQHLILDERSKVIPNVIKKFTSLEEMDLLLDKIKFDTNLNLDFNDEDFLYEFAEMVEEKYYNSSSTLKQTTYDFTFTFKKDPGSISWEIKDNKTNKLIKESNLLAVMYVAYLAKHSNSENKINTDDLYVTCKEISGEKIGNYREKGAKHYIYNALCSCLSSTDEDSPKFAKNLTEDQKDFRISLKKIYDDYCKVKKDYSYFKKNDEISINVIGL